MRECHSYWRTRNEEREATSSREERDKPRALANAEAGVRQLYSREMDVEEADRGIFAGSLERTLKLSLRAMQQWVTQTKAMVNLMVSRREKRELENQPDIRTAVTTVVTEEMEQTSRARQEQRQERLKPQAPTPRRRNTAAVTAQLRAARPKVCMIERIMGRCSALHKKRKKDKKKREEEKEAAKQAKEDKAAAKKKTKKTKYKSTRAREVRQNAPKPNTVIQVDRIRRGRLPKFKTYVEAADEPSLAQQQPVPQENTSSERGSEALNLEG
jgi:hypothetical protein